MYNTHARARRHRVYGTCSLFIAKRDLHSGEKRQPRFLEGKQRYLLLVLVGGELRYRSRQICPSVFKQHPPYQTQGQESTVV